MKENQNSKSTQNKMILNHLNEHGSITSLEDFNLYGITRLSARIWDLRHDYDVEIKSHSRTEKNRYGKKVSFAVYTLS